VETQGLGFERQHGQDDGTCLRAVWEVAREETKVEKRGREVGES
jgi:hypothetical protein